MRLNPRVRKLFTEPDAAFDHRSFKLVDQSLVTFCEADSFRELLTRFAEINAKDLDTPLPEALRQIRSGEDNGNAWTCLNDELLAFVRALPDPTVAVAAFLLCDSLEPQFRKASGSTFFDEVEGEYPGYEPLVEFTSPQIDEAFCVLGGGGPSRETTPKKRR